MTIQIQLPDKIGELFLGPARYRVGRGGRGGAKSHGFAAMALTHAYARQTRILCARELQNSIKDSVHKLLCDQIEKYQFPGFNVTDTYIKHRNGSEFIFRGLKTNASEIKSMEAINIAWIEEAQKVSQESWDLLVPTIREPGSEIWVTYNPEFEQDATSQMFGDDLPPDTKIAHVNYYDNPWFPAELEKERAYLERINPKKYRHVWLGEFKDPSEGGIVAYAFSEGNLDEGVTYDPKRRIYLTCDFNVDPMCWLLAHIKINDSGKREYEYFDEIAIENSNIPQSARIFAERYLAHKTGIIITGDANSGRARSDASDKANVIRWKILTQELSDAGMRNFALDVNKSNPRIKPRLEAFNHLLCDADNVRRIKINPAKCKRFVQALKTVRYIQGSDEVFIPTPKMIEKNPDIKWSRNDMLDAASYLTWKYDSNATDFKQQSPRTITNSFKS